MPYVMRVIKHKSEASFGEVALETELYVPPHKVKGSDKVIKPDAIPDAVLADLAATHPKEYGKVAEARGLAVALSPDDFAELSEAKAIAAVEKMDLDTQLESWFRSEIERATPRPKVLAAFEARGYTPDAYDDDEDEDDEGGE